MVRKLFKHEAIYYARTLLIFEIVLFSLAISTRFIMFFEFDHWVYRFIQGSSFVLFGLAAIACIYASIAMSVIRFYRNLFSQEGYLTFALPVSTNQHITVKLISSLIYQSVVSFSIFIATLIAISGDFLNELLKAIWYILNKAFEVISFKDGLNISIYLIYFCAILLFSGIYNILLFYTCICIGQLANRARIWLAVGCYFTYAAIVEILYTVFMIVINVIAETVDMTKFFDFISENPHLSLHVLFITIILLLSALIIVFYIVTHKIISKRLNLE